MKIAKVTVILLFVCRENFYSFCIKNVTCDVQYPDVIVIFVPHNLKPGRSRYTLSPVPRTMELNYDQGNYFTLIYKIKE